MPTVALSNVTRVDAAEATGGSWGDLAGGASVTETEFVYQNTASISEKVKTTESGVRYYNSVTSHAFSTNDRTAVLKMIITAPASLNATPSTSMIAEIGNADRTNYYRYYLYTDTTYPPDRSWLFEAINPNVSAWRDAVVGSPNLAVVDYYANAARMKGTSAKSENVAMDAIDFVDAGGGLILTGSDGSYADFLAFDQGTVTNRYGLATSREGAQFHLGSVIVGSATATATFRSTRETLIFPGGRTNAGFHRVVFDLANASTDPILQNTSIVGRGQEAIKRWFDTSADEVDGATEVITISGFADHLFQTGDAVLYSVEGGSAISDLTDATEYFVNRITATTLSLHTTRQDAIGDVSRRNLTAAGTGAHHSLTRQPDTRPDFVVTGTSGTLSARDSLLQRVRNVTLTSAAELLRTTVVNSGGTLTMATGLLTDCSILTPTVAEGVAFVVTADLEDITGTSFTAGEEGHAVQITAAGTYAYTGNSDSGYGPAKAEFNASTGVDGGTEVITTDAVHGLTDGDTVYYGDEGGTPITGLVDGGRYYVNALTTTTLALYVTRADAIADANRVGLTAGSSETHYIYSGRATILNSSGGLVTINISGGTTPTIRNTPGSTTVTSNPVTFTISSIVAGSEVGIYRVSDGLLLQFVESSGTSVAYAYDYAGDVAIYVIVQKLTHKWRRFNETLGATSKSTPANQQLDPDYLNA